MHRFLKFRKRLIDATVILLKSNLLALTFVISSLITLESKAQDNLCKFDYWEVIPDSVECEVYHLPDFDFRIIASDPNLDINFRKLCQIFEVSYSGKTTALTYCKNADKDASGPSFNINNRYFLADIFFEGCLNQMPSYGKVFVADGWGSAPENLKRIWRIKDKDKSNLCLP